jgi:hypothetical protein
VKPHIAGAAARSASVPEGKLMPGAADEISLSADFPRIRARVESGRNFLKKLRLPMW